MGVALPDGWLPVQLDLSSGRVGLTCGASPSTSPDGAPGRYRLLQAPLQKG